MTDKSKDRRLDLDALDERVEVDAQAEKEAASAIVAAMPQPEPVEETPEVERLREENEKLHALISQTLDARKRAREFMTIWSDPRKLPDLIQEVYLSHPNVQDIKKDLSDEHARQASRLIAHMALTYELHPLMSGMIYAWEQDNKLITEIGYRGYSEMIERDGMDYETREMTPEEREKHGLGPKDRGWLCFIHDWERVDRFTKRGQPAPAPHRGVGVWRAANPRKSGGTYPDPIPRSKSGDWSAEKNAIKSAARLALSFAVTKTAKPDAIDFVFSQGDDAWVMPVETAKWLSSYPAMVKRFEVLLVEHGVAEEDFNAFLGHNWRYTMLEAEELKAKFDAYIAQRDSAIEGVFEAKPVEETTPEPAPQAEEVAAVPAEPPVEEAPQVTEEPANAKTTPEQPAQVEQPAIPTLFDTPDTEQPAKKKKASTTRRKPVKPIDEAAQKCVRCEKVAPTGEAPFPFLCKKCANLAADEEAVKAA